MTIRLPDGEYSAFIFDCDGTLADTMALHFQAWQRAFRPHNFEFDEALYYSLGGVPARELIELLNERYKVSLPVAQIVDAKHAAYDELAGLSKPIEAVVAIARSHAGKLPMAVASGGARRSVTRTLAAIGLENFFDVVITSEDVTRGKPDPEPFLTAAKRMNVSPDACVVFEDADPGIEAAIAAGMRWVRVPQG
jgi:beta-phosphoglucomutase family hydrolase